MESEVININELSPKEKIDYLESQLLAMPQLPQHLEHVFTPGMYSRELYMIAGSMWTSERHKTQHQYAILEGCVSVYTEEDGEVFLKAPYKGITNPNTKRVIFVHENTRWVTFHPTDIQPVDSSKEAIEEAVQKIKKVIIDNSENLFLKENEITKQLKNS